MKYLKNIMVVIASAIGLMLSLALVIVYSAGSNQPDKTSALDAQIICNSIIPQKYPYKVLKKFEIMRVDNHWRWSWRLSKGSITCKVFDDGKYQIQ